MARSPYQGKFMVGSAGPADFDEIRLIALARIEGRLEALEAMLGSEGDGG